MITNAKCRRLLLPVLAGVLLGCLARPAKADDIDYLPTGAHVVMSANFQGFLKSKCFAELKKTTKELDVRPAADFETEMSKAFGIPVASIARVNMGMTFLDKDDYGRPAVEMIGIVTTTKAVTAAEMIAAKKWTYATFEEIKVGAFTIHQANYVLAPKDKDKAAKYQKGGSFCVIDGKTILYDLQGSAGLRKVLERNKKAELSENLQNGLKQADFSNTAVVVVDLAGLPASARANMVGIPIDGLKAVADNLRLLTLKVNEQEKASAIVTIFCSDAASAAEVKKVADVAVVALKTKIKDHPELKDMLKVRPDLAPVADLGTVSAQGNQVNIGVTTDAASAARYFFLSLSSKKAVK